MSGHLISPGMWRIDQLRLKNLLLEDVLHLLESIAIANDEFEPDVSALRERVRKSLGGRQ